jgi:dipeptidyl aminopeptidase/acylaminoacyl peptidase
MYSGLRVAGSGPNPAIVASWQSAVSPAEMVRIDANSAGHRLLTNAQRVQEIDWQPLREFWFTSKAGRHIHNFIALPPAFDETKKYPLFVVTHGGPHSMFSDSFGLRWNYHLLAQPGYVVLLTSYTGSTGFANARASDNTSSYKQNVGLLGDPLI